VVGGSVSLWIEHHGWDLSRIYGTSGFTISGLAMSTRIHARVTLPVLGTLGGAVLVAVMLMSLVPVRRAAQVPVADLLR